MASNILLKPICFNATMNKLKCQRQSFPRKHVSKQMFLNDDSMPTWIGIRLTVEWSLIVITFKKALMTLNKLNLNKESFSQSLRHWLLYSQYTPLNEGYQKPSLISSSTFPAFHAESSLFGFTLKVLTLSQMCTSSICLRNNTAWPNLKILATENFHQSIREEAGWRQEKLSDEEYIPPIIHFISLLPVWPFLLKRWVNTSRKWSYFVLATGVWMMAQSCFWAPSGMVKDWRMFLKPRILVVECFGTFFSWVRLIHSITEFMSHAPVFEWTIPNLWRHHWRTMVLT